MRDGNPLECRAGDHHGFASASQFQSYLDCPRKWGWPNLEGIRAPASPQQAFGTEMHALAERYLRDGVPIDLTSQAGLALMAGSHLLPRPGALDMYVEAHFALDLGGHEIHGFKDVELPGLVIDHKSTSDLAWSPSPEELAINVQACLYAYDNMLTYGGSTCDLRWVYYRRNQALSGACRRGARDL